MKTLSYLKRGLPALLVSLAFLMPAREATAQLGDDLYLFGFFQGQYRYSDQQGVPGQETVSSFSLQQLNAFLMKDFNASFSAFVNAELTNSFSTDRGWGSLRLEEAWARYSHSAKFNVKAGLLVPTFNNLNEVKNRTPLLPYVFRPMAYETSFSGILNVENFTPQQAHVQINGALPLGQVRFDYAAYVGNNSSDFAADATAGTVASGTDLSTSKLLGARLGLRWGSAKIGVSGSHDTRDFGHDLVEVTGQPAEVLAELGLPAAVEVGEVGRTRIGADLSFYRGGFFGEAELIYILSDTDDEQDDRLALASQMTQGALTDGLDASFYYGMLGYNFSEKLFAYGMYNFIMDEGLNAVQAAGLDVISAGAGFRPIDGIATKAQYIYVVSRENPLTKYSSNSLLLGVSVSF